MNRKNSGILFVAGICAIALAIGLTWPANAQRTASNPFGAQLNVQDAGTCSTTNSFAWQTLPTNAGITTLNLAGTFTATVTVRESNNGGTTWTTINTLTTTGTTTYGTNGFTDFCADVTAFTSGIVQVSITTGTQSTVASGSSSISGTNGQVLFNSNGTIGGAATLTFSAGALTIGSPGVALSSPSNAILSLASGQGTLRTGAVVSNGGTFSASGCANSTLVGGATAGSYVSVTAGACTVTITMGSSVAAINGWVCDAHDITTAADANNVTQGNLVSTSQATLVEGTVTANDVIIFKCVGY